MQTTAAQKTTSTERCQLDCKNSWLAECSFWVICDEGRGSVRLLAAEPVLRISPEVPGTTGFAGFGGMTGLVAAGEEIEEPAEEAPLSLIMSRVFDAALSPECCLVIEPFLAFRLATADL
mmetsp:Transcript_3923/g.7061  ORF Transcript_3923/g.7061 Transcript_3923/m.7061 type:complete len:120 (-) Transcript_3923:216-575(-)